MASPSGRAVEILRARDQYETARFDRFVGIDYSGAEVPTQGLTGLQVYEACPGEEPHKVTNPAGTGRRWTRRHIAHWLAEEVAGRARLLVGIDHAFSLPDSYLQRHGIRDWPRFLDDFCEHWPTDEDNTYVEFLMRANPRTGTADEFRLTERWTSSAKSVFQFSGQGTVAYSTHAGIPWLRFLRRHDKLQGRLHFWPFDGMEPPADVSVIAEVYPAVFKNRYPADKRNPHEHDAYATARWMEECQRRSILDRYFSPPLVLPEQALARREGWILGIA